MVYHILVKIKMVYIVFASILFFETYSSSSSLHSTTVFALKNCQTLQHILIPKVFKHLPIHCSTSHINTHTKTHVAPRHTCILFDHIHKHIDTHTHARTHARMHTHTHTHAHTQTHIHTLLVLQDCIET